MDFKSAFKLFSILLLTMINQSLATEDPWKSKNIHKQQIRFIEEGFLKKDEKYFRRKPWGLYLPIKNFDNVFPLSTTQDQTLQMYVSQIFVRKHQNTESLGSATVTKSDGYTFEAVSAKHIFNDSKSAHMLQGEGMVDGKINYLYKGIIEEICPSQHRDVTLIRGRYEDGWKLPNREQRKLLRDSVTTLCSSPTISHLGIKLLSLHYGFLGALIDRIVNYPTAYVFGYPAGTSYQRVRSGLVFPSIGRHEISTLPGDSGAGLFRQINGFYHLFGIHTGGSKDYVRSVEVELPNHIQSFGEYRYNQFQELTQKNLEEEFTSCVRISKRPILWRLRYGISSFSDRFQ